MLLICPFTCGATALSVKRLTDHLHREHPDPGQNLAQGDEDGASDLDLDDDLDAGDIDLEADDVTPRRDVVVALRGRHHECEDRGRIPERVREVELAGSDVHSQRGLGSVPLQKRASSVVQ